KGKVQLFQGALQMIVNQIERMDPDKIGLDLADFLPHTSENILQLEERLRGTLLRLGNPHLRALAECFLIDEDFLAAYRRCPARVPDLTGEPFPPELLLRLKHMIVSHHGSYEYGSPKLPMTPEAIALHYLDNFDAKVHLFTRDIGEARSQASAWTPFNQSLQRRLFKGTGDGTE